MGGKYVIVTATVHLFQVSLNMYIYMIAQMPDLNIKVVVYTSKYISKNIL